MHAVGLRGPGGETLGVDGEFLLHGLDGGAGGEEEDLESQKKDISMNPDYLRGGNGRGRGRDKQFHKRPETH